MREWEVFKEALSIVLKHKGEVDKMLFESVHYKTLGIKIGDESKENLRKWFIITTGPGWRAGPPPRFEKRVEMIKRPLAGGLAKALTRL